MRTCGLSPEQPDGSGDFAPARLKNVVPSQLEAAQVRSVPKCWPRGFHPASRWSPRKAAVGKGDP